MRTAYLRLSDKTVETWVDSTPGQKPQEGYALVAPADLPSGWRAEPVAYPVPERVSLWAIRALLARQGLAGVIEENLRKIPGDDGIIAISHWEYGNYVERNHPLINNMGALLGLSQRALDDIFRHAAIMA